MSGDNGDDDQEKLITKLQIEFTSGSPEDVMEDRLGWDLGLLYLTNKSIWMVNREKQKTHVSLENVRSVGEILPRGSRKTTKFTEVLGADHVINLTFVPEAENGGPASELAALLAGARDVLGALRDQLVIRVSVDAVASAQKQKLSQKELMRKLSVLLELNISDEEQLSYLLGVDEKELVNLLLERNRLEVSR